MPAHIKASVLGPALTVPVSRGRFALGTWQGVYLCEHRDHGGARSLVVTFDPPPRLFLRPNADYRLLTSTEERVALLERALLVDPRNPETLGQLSSTYRNFRQYERSLALQRQLMEVRPGDNEVKADLYYTQFLRTGSWAAYDEWRSTLPRDAGAQVRAIKNLDIDRALARGDLDEALRLIEVDSDDSKKIAESRCACKEVPRVLLLRAKGDAAAAAKAARSAMELADSELKKAPQDTAELWAKAMLYAIGGQKEPAFAWLAKAVAVHKSQGNLCAAAQTQKTSAGLHALLGERRQALEELSRQLQFHSTHVHELRLSIDLYPLWNDAEFKTLLDNPANRVPISFDTKCD